MSLSGQFSSKDLYISKTFHEIQFLKTLLFTSVIIKICKNSLVPYVVNHAPTFTPILKLFIQTLNVRNVKKHIVANATPKF